MKRISILFAAALTLAACQKNETPSTSNEGATLYATIEETASTKTYMDAQAWEYFFTEDFAVDPKAQAKFLKDDTVKTALKELAGKFADMTDFSADAVEQAIRAAETAHGISQGKLNQPLRIALTGIPVGAGVYETAGILGAASCVRRIGRTLEKCV